MAKFTISLVKKADLKKNFSMAKPGEKASGAGLVIVSADDDTVTVMGTTASGALAPIDAVATLTPVPTSSDTTVITVDPPVAMTDKMHGVPAVPPVLPTANRTATISYTATWNDPAAGIGPFGFDLPCTVTGDAITGVIVVPGQPVPRP
jgi:hypothetical protein